MGEDGEAELITETEYGAWIPPAVALGMLAPVNRMNAMAAIEAQLASGVLRACARDLVATIGGDRVEHHFIVFDIPGWIDSVGDPFWATGDVTVAPDNLRNSNYRHLRVPGRGPTFYLHGIRFDPVRIAIIATQLGGGGVAKAAPAPARVLPPYAAQPTPSAPQVRKVTKDELRQWFPAYERASSDFRFDVVMLAALANFSPRPVTRQPLREIIGEFERTKTRGKPVSS